MDQADIYRIFNAISAQYTFLSAVHRTFSKIDHILRYKTSLSKYKKIEIIPRILSDHNALILEISNKNNSKKPANNWKLNNTLFNDQWVIDDIKEENKMFLEVNENENTTQQNPQDTAKAILRGKFIAMCIYIKSSERSQISDPILQLKLLEKQEQENPKTSRKREII
jgi:hypothetical protein